MQGLSQLHRNYAIYRLIEGSGREHLGQVGDSPIPHSYNDVSRVGLLNPGDGNAMGRYVERYIYDAVGNFLSMQHRDSDSSVPGWTREYAYNEVSQIESSGQNNRLSSTTVNNGPTTDRYIYDRHGNLTRLPHLGGAHPRLPGRRCGAARPLFTLREPGHPGPRS